MSFRRSAMIALASAALVAGACLSTAPAQAAVIAKTDADCTNPSGTFGGYVYGATGDVLEITANLTACRKLKVDKSLVSGAGDVDAQASGEGTVTASDDETYYIYESTTDFASLRITLTAAGPVNNKLVQVLTTAGYESPTSWVVSITEAPPVVKSITIQGTNRLVKGRPTVVITGTAVGLAVGETVIARVRFPGQTEYSTYPGTTVRPDGTIRWTLQTGRTAYVYFLAADRSVRSNRVKVERG